MVWNAHVMAIPVWDKPDVLEQLDDLLRAPGTAPQMIAVCADLAARRQQYFANDLAPSVNGASSSTIEGVRVCTATRTFCLCLCRAEVLTSCGSATTR
jgi:hypothetical protein